jgi:HSP20 family protein
MLWGIDPWRELERMRRELDGVFSGYTRTPAATSFPLVNIYDEQDSMVVTAELAGMAKDDVQITYNDGVLTLEGKRGPVPGTEKMTVVRRERAVGEFQKSLSIPYRIQADKISASFTDGVLTVTLPKTEDARPKQISIQAQ